MKSTIYEHPKFATFITGINAHFAAWREKSAKTLKALKAGCNPKEIISALSEDLLAYYTGKPLINHYDVYQHLMDYWAKTMQDDCYHIAADGWKAETTRIIEKDKKGKERDKGWTCNLVPKNLVVARYFAKEQEAIDQLTVELETISAQITELEEEHGGEEGLFSEARTEADEGKEGKITKVTVTKRLKEIADDREAEDEIAVLNNWMKLVWCPRNNWSFGFLLSGSRSGTTRLDLLQSLTASSEFGLD